ncbi:MAG: hypothetical protein M0002_08245 [Rhodospirillales bacterium]|nr:hypothetical protein [Rhodospirillales bacterium]
MADHSGMRLGKTRARGRPRALGSLKYYLAEPWGRGTPLPPVPPALDRSGDVTAWGMLGNDRLGDCTIAAVGHAALLWSSRAGHPRAMTPEEAIAGYEAFGYRPGDAASDQGANALDVLAHWSGAGFEIGGVKDVVAGFCAIEPAFMRDVRAGVAWLGAVYAGLEMPLAAQRQEVWDAPAERSGDAAAGSWGGHAVPIVGYGPEGLVCITWGEPKRMTWAFWAAYASEAYGLLSEDFVRPKVDWDALEADMQAVRSGL